MPERNNHIGFSGKVISEEIDFPFPRHPGEIVSPIPRPVGGHIPKVVTNHDRDIKPGLLQTILRDLRNLSSESHG